MPVCLTRLKLTTLLLCKALLVAGFLFYLINTFLPNRPSDPSMKLFSSLVFKQCDGMDSRSATNINHLVFSIAGSANGLKFRRSYLEAWWRPNITRGFLWLDRDPREHLPWPASFPPYRVSEDVRKFKDHGRFANRPAIRIARTLLETFREVNESARWYIMSDDDTVFLVDNLLEVLSRYDHTKYFYIGQNSESIFSNEIFGYEMAFGGAGYALSFPLAQALARNLDQCIKGYATFHVGDHILKSCVSHLGVPLTHERGFHQIDFHGDLSGLLSAHQPVPLLTLHHLDVVEPIFPFMDQHQSLNHLMKTINIDPARSLQQTICYHKETNWSFSIAWGYSVYIYEEVISPNLLERPLETFRPWKNLGRPHYSFNTRPLNRNPCAMPHLFFFDSIEPADGSHIVTSYTRRWPRKLQTCLSSGSHSADPIMKIRVFSPTAKLSWVGRRECCDVAGIFGKNVTEVNIRACGKDEMFGLM